MKHIIICLLLLSSCAKAPKSSSPTPYPALELSKMACETVGDQIQCQGLDANSPNGIPDGCLEYAHGNRQFLNGVLATATAYDCGLRDNGLRCFYFLHEPISDALIEDVICQPDHTGP